MSEEIINPNVEIKASIVDQITFASHQNDVGVIADLVLCNNTEQNLENLELVFECEPALIAPKTWKIDRLSSKSEIRIRDRKVSLSGALLAELNERLRSQLKLTLRKDNLILAEYTQQLIGLARNEWGGASYMPELLAAFAMPNDPAITTILKEAGEALRKAGEQPALDGYQSRSKTRVWQIASAIWTAVSSRRLVYAEPPASFETQGQKVRTPDEILSGGLATCLDSALLFAAAFEQAGLYPVIAITQGHALCGVWLQPQQLPSLTAEDSTDLRKYIDLNELVLFETTMAVNEPPVSFSKAVAEGKRRVSEEMEKEFVYALDVKQARRRQITPLGTVAKISGFSGEASETILGFEAAPNLGGFDIGVGDIPAPDTPETRLDHWKRKLLDLTKRNRLLNLKPSKTAIRLYCPSPAVLEDKLADGKKITVIPMAKMSGEKGERDAGLFHGRTGEDYLTRFAQEALDKDQIVADMPQADLDSGLVELYRKAKNDLEEGGANTLYLALGMLKWKQSPQESQIYRAPLILVPVKLERTSAASKVKIHHHEDEPVFNMTLLEMLRQDFELRIPALEGELPKDESGVDVPKIWNIVRHAVREMPGFEMVEEVILSTFSFAKYLMWKDLAERTATLKQSPFVKHLIDRPKEPYSHSAEFLRDNEIDEKIKPSDLFMPLQADSSQVVAVYASGQKGDFVLEGPPGTGKSQTIANIISHNLAMGRKVLFVSEKMTALEVVYKRLQERGLGDFCLELHSNKANKREVLNQLGRSWRNRKLQSQAQWNEQAGKVEEKRNRLNNLVKSLHTPWNTGISPRMAIGRVVNFKEKHRFGLDWQGNLETDQAKNSQDLERLEDVAKRLGQNFSELSSDDHEVFAKINRSEWSNAWQSNLVDTSRQLINAFKNLSSAASNFSEKSGLPICAQTLLSLKAFSKFAENIPDAASRNLAFALDHDSSVFNQAEEALSLLGKYEQEKVRLSCAYPDEGLKEAPFELWKQSYSEANSAVWPINIIKRKLLGHAIRKLLSLPSHPILEQDLSVIEQMRSIRSELDSKVEKLSEGTAWKGLGTDTDKFMENISAGKRLRESMVSLAKNPTELANLRVAAHSLCVEGRDMIQPGMPIAQAAAQLVESYSHAEGIFATYSKEIENDFCDDVDVMEVSSNLQKIIDLQPRINAWCRWQMAKKEAVENGLGSIVTALNNGTIEASDTIGAFKTAYCSWLAPRLIDSRPELKTFSAVAHEDLINEFRTLDQNLSDLSVDYIRAKLSGNIPDFNSTNRPAGYGVLSRELQKKMRHKPVRQLVQEIGDTLTTLTPCLLMSPLSVSQFLPADKSLFDLVVFDEASQITVWDAIGAIARGKNVIVVGDPKQMPPTNFFDRAAADDDGDDNGTEDLESILDEGLAANIKVHRLTGHYRSRHESLISFSNHRYYDSELVTYPSAETCDSVVSLRNVRGIYQRGKGRTNPTEAKAVVAEVIRRLRDPILKQLSIGIVTFNSEQKKLIDDLLDEERKKDPNLEAFFESGSLDEQVVVKNLETVQGHERDVVLLSIGYGPDTPEAKTMPMNFGPLNKKGGERRLNVAITRAKSEMVIFSSFDPAMIDLTRTSSIAVRDLKHYMEFAQRGPVALAEAIKAVAGETQYDSDFEKAVAEGLRKLGWTVHTQIGVSKFRIDQGIVHPDFPGKYLAGIECDGAAYHSSPSARDRDRIRHSILENLGWKLLRVWSTDYFIDPTRALDKIHQQLQVMLDADRVAIAAAAAHPEESNDNLVPDVIMEEEVIEKQEPQSVIEEIDSINPDLAPNKFYEASYMPIIKQYACSLVDDIGPITFKHLSEKIARAHGFQRTGPQIKGIIWKAVSKARNSIKSKDGHTILWPEGMPPQQLIEYRGLTVNGQPRSWNDVPYPEKLSLAYAIRAQNPLNGAEAMATKIGFGRLHSTTRDELEKLLKAANEEKAA